MTRLTDPRRDGLARSFERLFGEGSAVGCPDSQLLDRFATRRDEAAFAAIVERHGPMVLGVCRRYLRDANDVDDAFQAVFLVLARKAGGLRSKELLGNWLFGVSCRVAARARLIGDRRREKAASGEGARLDVDARRPEAPDPAYALADREEWVALHEEVQRLPHRYRSTVVACYFEGRTHEEAASQLRCPVGTVKGRLSRARDLLRRRLESRGAKATVGTLATSLASTELRAAVPVALAADAVRHALAVSAAPSAWMTTPAISLSVRSLTAGAIQAMFYSQIKALALPALTLSAGLLAAGASLAYSPQEGAGAAPASPATDEGPKADPPAETMPDEPRPEFAISKPLSSRDPIQTFELMQSILGRYRNSVERFAEEANEVEGDKGAQAEALARHGERVRKLLNELRNEPIDDAAAPMLSSFADYLGRDGMLDKGPYGNVGVGAPIDFAKAEPAKAAAEDADDRRAEATEDEAKPEKEDEAEPAKEPREGDFGGGGGGMSGPSPDEIRRNIAGLAASVAKYDQEGGNAQVGEALALPFTLKSDDDSTLGDLLGRIRESVRTSDGKKLPVYVDPVGLRDADATLDSAVTIDLEDVPLKFSLRLMLKQLGLAYCIRDGVLIISSLEGVQQELLEVQRELMAKNPEKVIVGPGGAYFDGVAVPQGMATHGGFGGMGGGMR